MTRPAKRIDSQILATLDRRPRLRYGLTSKGQKALESGDILTSEAELLDSIVEAIQANNKQAVSLATIKRFHKKPIKNADLRALVEKRLLSVISRGKYSYAVE